MQKVFPGQGALFKSWSCQLLNKRLLVKRNLVVRAGLYVKENLFIVHTSKESYQGIGERKLDRLCGALSQGKLVQLYTRAIKTCQGKLLEKNLFIEHTSKESYQGTCQGKLDRLHVRGLICTILKSSWNYLKLT